MSLNLHLCTLNLILSRGNVLCRRGTSGGGGMSWGGENVRSPWHTACSSSGMRFKSPVPATAQFTANITTVNIRCFQQREAAGKLKQFVNLIAQNLNVARSTRLIRGH
jgi:hypothetical protein